MNQRLTQNISVRPSLFWDVDLSKLSTEKNKDFIIRRVFDRGTLEEILDLIVHYGEDAVQSSLLKAPSLRKPTVYLAAAFFNKKTQDFACYNTTQFQEN